MPILNARIPELPLNAVLKGTYYGVVYNIEDDTTKKFPMSELLASQNTGNFEYLVNTAYNDLDVVTFNGEWWQATGSVAANIAPGTDPAKWVQISQSGSGFVFWSAGVYPQDDVFVLYDLAGVKGMYQLIDATRPYVSSNFETELAAGDWELLFSNATAPISPFRGPYNASTNLYPGAGLGSGSGGAIRAGDEWSMSVSDTTMDGGPWPVGTIMKALVNVPGQTITNWRLY